MKEFIILCAVALTINATGQKMLKNIQAQGDAVTCLAISSDASKVLTGGLDNRAYLWDAKSGGKIKTFANKTPVTGVAFNSAASYLALGTGARAYVFDCKEYKPVLILKEQTDNVTAIAYNPLNNDLAVANDGGNVVIYDDNGAMKATCQGHDGAVRSVAYSPDGKMLVTGGEDGKAIIWDAESGFDLHTIQTSHKTVEAVAWSADASFVATGGTDGSATVYKASSQTVINDFKLKKSVNALCFSPDVQYLFIGSEDGKIEVVKMETWQVENDFEANDDGVKALAMSDKNALLVSVGGDGMMRIYDCRKLGIGKKAAISTEKAPKLVCSAPVLTENNDNGILEASEKPAISFKIDNKGEGDAYNVFVKVSMDGKVRGIDFKDEISIGNLAVDAVKEISIPITMSDDPESGAGEFIISIEEGNGHNPPPLRVGFQSQGAFQYSYIMVLSHEFSSATGKAEIGAPITLKLKLKNTSEGIARNVKVNYHFPDGVLAVDRRSEILPELKPGEEKDLSVQFYADKGYDAKKIAIIITMDNVAFTNANDLVFDLTMNETLPGAETYQPIEVQEVLATEEPLYRGGGDPLAGLNVGKSKEMVIGKYYALIVGINAYSGAWPKLQNAVNDAKAVEAMLRSRYKFDQFITLYDGQATRQGIISKLEYLISTVKPSDNVFIFYSGHGDYKQSLKKGYWVPVDAKTQSTAAYISNSDLQTYINGIKSKHTLLVSDACFSGDIFRGNTVSVPFEESEKYYKEVHNLSSRQAITSGGIEPVMDGGRDGHSVFTYYFLKTLQNNGSKFLDAGQLYTKIKIPVINNSEQTPKISPIKNTGDEGGQFLFIKK